MLQIIAVVRRFAMMKNNSLLEKELTKIKNYVDLASLRACYSPEKTAFIFLEDGETQEKIISYENLDLKARAIAVKLQSKIQSGGTVLLLYPSCIEYITAFLGCLYAKVIAVPLYPPEPAQFERSMSRLNAIVKNTMPSLILTDTLVMHLSKEFLSEESVLNKMEWMVTDHIETELASSWEKPRIDGDTLAFLQYTSGSTGNPKGVKVTHQNILHNQLMIRELVGNTEESIDVTWLPLYHDMGLIGNILHTIYIGGKCVIMSPSDFLRNPMRWLYAFSKYKGTSGAAPNFAYEILAQKIKSDKSENLDLSTWVCAVNSSESIHPDTIGKFSKAFEPYGFNKKAFVQCYGLAEATLILTASRINELPNKLHVKNSEILKNIVMPAEPDEVNTRELVSCGKTYAGQELVIVDPNNRNKCSENEIGEIWIKGPSVTRGYWNNPEETQRIFHAYMSDTDDGPYLRTGDLGFIKDEKLYITGRLKDIIIVCGQNHYPQDIEFTVSESHESLRKGCTAAFSFDQGDIEKLIVVQEVKQKYVNSVKIDEVIDEIRKAISIHHGIPVYAIILIHPRTIFKTSSGKIQRTACKAAMKFNGSSIEIHNNIIKESLVKMWIEDSGEKYPPSQRYFDKKLTKLWAEVMQSKLETILRRKIPIQYLCEAWAFKDMAIQRTPFCKHESAFPNMINRIARKEKKFPLSFAQKRLWFVQQLNKISPLYNLHIAIQLNGKVDIAAVENALKSIANRHETLRTRFIINEGLPYQIIDEAIDDDLMSIENLRGLNKDQREIVSQSIIREEISKPFNLESDHLLRVLLN